MKEFYSKNSTMIMIGIAIIILILGFILYRKMTNNSSSIANFVDISSPTQFNKLTDTYCDPNTGVCQLQENMLPQLSEGQDQETIQKQLMMHQQMMKQQQQYMEQNQAQNQTKENMTSVHQDMSPEEQEHMMMQQQMMQQQMQEQQMQEQMQNQQMMHQQSENMGGQ